jgi:magnesium-transporting ATPase (P-type)
MIAGLKEMGRTVAGTGEGINDVKGLDCADVGFAMGSGVSAVKNVSKMILVDDNLMSIINAVLWGRNIYSNVRKFIQFQLTVNLSALVILFIIALASGLQAFSVVQLLWLNMIMDLLAALALAAERPQLSIIENPPVRSNDQMITLTMWRQILGMTAYITLVMIFMFFFLDDIQDLQFDSFSPIWYDQNDNPTAQNKYFTMLFNIFVYLHLFNEINCRKVSNDQYNVFDHLFSNFYFLGVFITTIAVQYFLVQYGGRMVRCSELTDA